MLNKRSRKKSYRKKSLKRVNKKSSKKKKIKGGEQRDSIIVDSELYKVLPMNKENNKLQLLKLSNNERLAYYRFKNLRTTMSSEDPSKYHNYSVISNNKEYQFRIGYNENPGKIFMNLKGNLFYRIIDLREGIEPIKAEYFKGSMKN